MSAKRVMMVMLVIAGVSFLASLGLWQLSRAQQKQHLLETFTARTQAIPFTLSTIPSTADEARFFRLQLTGRFDNQHVILLDNKTYGGKIGYEVYTPFISKEIAILVDRGFVEIGPSRQVLPRIRALPNLTTLTGLIDAPPKSVAFGPMRDTPKSLFPARLEFINLTALAKELGYPLAPFIVKMDRKDPRAYPLTWQSNTLSPERHLGYAAQWFALAITLLILCVTCHLHKKN
ncbi:MAG: hypothetical protein ACD_21C00066G0002 [uncultured bacterium]|nr:MAG: hypothetical protein ACD_21C00066G0002 [uncultured bacterium]